MPFPLAIAGVSAAIAGVYAALPSAVQNITKDEFMRLLAGDLGELEREAIKGALLKMGLELDPDTGINAQSITEAINAGPLAGSGVELSNIFDREAVKGDLQKVALAFAAQSFGLEVKSLSVESIKEALRGEVSRMVREQIGDGGGDLVDAAPDLVAIVRMIEAAQKHMQTGEDGTRQKPQVSMTREAISNRERQARYRATHTRHWEDK